MKINEIIKSEYLFSDSSTAGAEVAITSASIDRIGFFSANVIVNYNATLATSKTLELTVSVLQSDDNDTFSSGVEIDDFTVLDTEATGVFEVSLNLNAYKRYLKVSVTPVFSADDTDTAIISGTLVLGNSDSLPK